MNIRFTFRHVDSTPAIRSYVEAKFERLKKYMQSPVDVHVVISSERKFQKIDVQLNSKTGSYHATHSEPDVHAAVDLVVDKLERQLERRAKKNHKHKGETATADVVYEPQPESIVADEAEALGEV